MTIVWVWLIVSVIGLIVSSYLTRESLYDLRSLSVSGQRIAAWSRFSRESIRVSVHGLYILAALAALGIIPWLLPFIVWFLMWGNIALVLNSVIDARTRRLLREPQER